VHQQTLRTPAKVAPPQTEAQRMDAALEFVQSWGWTYSDFFLKFVWHEQASHPDMPPLSPTSSKAPTTSPPGFIIHKMLSHPIGKVNECENYSLTDYTALKTSIRHILRSFAVQTTKSLLVSEAKPAVRSDNGLHASLRKNSHHQHATLASEQQRQQQSF
jgi:hypothetical protein